MVVSQISIGLFSLMSFGASNIAYSEDISSAERETAESYRVSQLSSSGFGDSAARLRQVGAIIAVGCAIGFLLGTVGIISLAVLL